MYSLQYWCFLFGMCVVPSLPFYPDSVYLLRLSTSFALQPSIPSRSHLHHYPVYPSSTHTTYYAPPYSLHSSKMSQGARLRECVLMTLILAKIMGKTLIWLLSSAGAYMATELFGGWFRAVCVVLPVLLLGAMDIVFVLESIKELRSEYQQ